MKERQVLTLPGVPMVLILLVLLALCAWWLFKSVEAFVSPLPPLVAGGLVSFCAMGFFMVQPNQAAVMQFFGKYVGSERTSGLRWANPFYTKKAVTLRVRNFESSKLKVNDLEGSPIEIAAVVVWQVHDAAEAVFNVDDYENFVQVQSEAALRQMATSYPYDLHEEHKIALRSHAHEINEHLRNEVQDRLAQAGLTVIEARVSHLAYAPEIAQAMLQRQQAAAIIAARTRIVEGAVTMVHMALEQLARKDVVHLDEERKAAMVSNLLVVLCGERGTQPVVNTGTLYNG
ncbi:SPFH domain-containing protein [Steroidobacter cummioxidans]|uniref:SPFH domain-containing protein n=1 Tax=Steroidobacter cummioxidans TaxID=1803913 RepID=UPI000E31834C|nr:SPFH domain-containing protein [Steroidobacter cummioxidans]